MAEQTGEYGPIRARRIIREWEERNPKREGEPTPDAVIEPTDAEIDEIFDEHGRTADAEIDL